MAAMWAACPSLTSPQSPKPPSCRPSTARRNSTCCPRAMPPRPACRKTRRSPNPKSHSLGTPQARICQRVDTYPLSRPGLILNRLIQGGERFQVLTLASPGSVTLRQVGVQAKFFIPRPSANRGFFHCSDPALNEIWHLGSKTVELCSVPAGSLPTTWTVTAQGVKVPGNEYTGYQGGAAWTDYTATFDVQVLSNEAAWLVRALSSEGFRLVLAADNDALGISKPNTLRAYTQGTKTVLGEATLADIKP